MSIEYNGVLVSTPVVFYQLRTNADSRTIFEIQDLTIMLNNTINTLFGLINLQITLPTTDQPYFSYNEVTKLFSFTALKSAFSNTLPTPINIYLNNPLFAMLQGFPIYSDAIKGFKLLITDLKNNSLPTNLYYTMTQQASSFERISDFVGLVLTSNMMTKNEYSGLQLMGGTNPTTAQSSEGAQNIYNIGLPILQDYVPQDLNIDTFHNNIVYSAITPYRQVELLGDAPFYSISINVYVQNTLGTLRQIYIPPNGSASIKMMFTKKVSNKYA
jgi:hypothetical protein